MRKILRIVIALIFIASGFVKAVDVVGFSFKLEEYFSPSVFNMPFLEKFALPVAVFIVALEIILGIMLLLRIQLKKTLIALIALCIFFAFLTFYSAYFNKVTDCGCFGDAIKFTPWQSFVKDIVLLLGLIAVWFLYQKDFVKPEKRNSVKISLLTVSMLATAFIIGFGILSEPLIDFRDYKIGTDLKAEKQKISQDPDVYKTFYVLKNKKNGTEKKVDQDEYVNNEIYWKDGSDWEILNDKTTSEIVKKGYSSEISKFRLEDKNGNDVSEQILSLPKVYLLFSYKPQDISDAEIAQAEKSLLKRIGKTPVYGVSPEKNIFKQIPNLFMDATPIKTIARSNPFVLTLQSGKIVQKQSLHGFLK